MKVYNFDIAAGNGMLTQSTLNSRREARSPAELLQHQEALLKSMVTEAQLQIYNLELCLTGHRATLRGTSERDDHRIIAILLVGNTTGIAEVADAMDPVQQAEQPFLYTIRKNDSLSSLARQFYGDVLAYNRIFEANPLIISDPSMLYEGQRIIIPDYRE